MSIRRHAPVAAAAAVALLATTFVAVAPAQAATGTYAMHVVAGPGEPGGAQVFAHDGQTEVFNAQSFPGAVLIQGWETPSSQFLTVYLAAKPGESLIPGATYAGARERGDEYSPALRLEYASMRCPSDGTGAFTILEYEVDPVTEQLVRFAAVFDHHCGSDTVGTHGSLYWNSTLPTRARTSWAMSGDATGSQGATVQVSGALADAQGAPLGGEQVGVRTTTIGRDTIAASATTSVSGTVTRSPTLGIDDLQVAVVFPGDATNEPSIATWLVSAPPRRAATLTSALPSPVWIFTTQNVTGVLSDSEGPVAGAEVEVYRAGGDVTVGTTGADGAYSVPLYFGKYEGAWYQVRFRGNAATAPVTSSVVASVEYRPALMTFTAPSTASRATPYAVSGSLVDEVGAPIAGATIHLARHDIAGDTEATTTTGDDGSFRYDDTPAVGGAVAWTAVYNGDFDRNAAIRRLKVTVSRLPTSLSIKVRDVVYPYGSLATVTAHLGTTYSGRSVKLLAQSGYSSSYVGVADGVVDGNGNITGTFRMKARTVFTAQFAGDERYAPVTVKVARNVMHSVSITTLGWYKKVGQVSVYHPGASPTFGFRMTPTTPGACLDVAAQRLISGVWRTVAYASCVKLSSTSRAVLTLTNSGKPGRMRIAALSPKTRFLVAGVSPWTYFSFV